MIDAMARVIRLLVIVALAGGAVLLARSHGRVVGLAALAGVFALLVVVYVVLPRLAHQAFESGRHDRAELFYGLVRLALADRASRSAVDVSLAGCLLAREDWRGALARLDRVDPAALGPSARAAWHNNRAYANARGRLDLDGALRDVDEAMRLRPDVAGFRHTRGIVLLALDRVDEAIRELDAVWSRMEEGEAAALLEAERCYDLGVAWLAKGEREYAADYLNRARTIAPASTWAERAGTALAGRA